MRGGATSFICLAYFAVGGCAETQTAGIEIRDDVFDRMNVGLWSRAADVSPVA